MACSVFFIGGTSGPKLLHSEVSLSSSLLVRGLSRGALHITWSTGLQGGGHGTGAGAGPMSVRLRGEAEGGDHVITRWCLVLEPCPDLGWWQSCLWSVNVFLAACADVDDPRLLGCGAQHDG